MDSDNTLHCRRHSWPPEEYVSKATLQLFDFDSAAPPEQAWRRRLNSHANVLKEFSLTFMEKIKMIICCPCSRIVTRFSMNSRLDLVYGYGSMLGKRPLMEG
ncbi:hypothetical protein JRO89_XS03G0060600 [Xanthoceras sorbifolium]|uniref:Uncharacterized protein n=1 Tax=Xanthoceras sorbifolium TaxID=99658 RepID=A0ABQ8I8V9_9ROSI|nr:hypothetical protein JRO89_XS03G0060600 [Xanthoceras sorbifolium]